MRRNSGFTLVEVLVALLLGAIGLLGTLAVQQAVIGASKAANDAAVALRLASQKLEEFSTVLTTGNPNNLAPLPNVDQFQNPLPSIANPIGNVTWRPPVYLNAEGLAAAAASPEYRWTRQWRVVNVAINQPYVISVTVTYKTSTGDPKTVRLDMERRKAW
ncbi:MAG TPA: prepilin-type N-terminal cleavage/methylation domain-containing protein [Polyangia bacterium]|jgi:prepilin-type N-terminal cleavage/methylation domain-containing protein|nr:prepilin-type N-terminal cleavage/methylation domain-containing protein [Polyangia bacterium]